MADDPPQAERNDSPDPRTGAVPGVGPPSTTWMGPPGRLADDRDVRTSFASRARRCRSTRDRGRARCLGIIHIDDFLIARGAQREGERRSPRRDQRALRRWVGGRGSRPRPRVRTASRAHSRRRDTGRRQLSPPWCPASDRRDRAARPPPPGSAEMRAIKERPGAVTGSRSTRAACCRGG